MTGPFWAILWQEWVLMKRKFWVLTSSALVTPLLYLLAFGWGLGSQMNLSGGGSYLQFIMPGLVGMNTMVTSYSNVTSHVSISRIFYQTFESYMIAPLRPLTYVFAKILTGVGYGIYGAILMIVPLAIFGGAIHIGWYFCLILLANCFAFSALGLFVALSVNNHQVLTKFSTFVITPMTFLCGTFFDVSKMPSGFSQIITVLPLSQANAGLRAVDASPWQLALHLGVLLAYFVVFFIGALVKCRKAE